MIKTLIGKVQRLGSKSIYLRKAKFMNLEMLNFVESHYVNRIYSTRRVNVTIDQVKEWVHTIVIYLANCNRMGETDTFCTFLNRPTNQIEIMEEFKDLVAPASIRLSPDVWFTKDLVERYQPGVMKSMSYDYFITAQANIRRVFKSDLSSRMVTLESLRKKISLIDALPKVSVKGKVQDNDGKGFIPYYLKEDVVTPLYANVDAVYNCDEKDCIADYIRNVNFG